MRNARFAVYVVGFKFQTACGTSAFKHAVEPFALKVSSYIVAFWKEVFDILPLPRVSNGLSTTDTYANLTISYLPTESRLAILSSSNTPLYL